MHSPPPPPPPAHGYLPERGESARYQQQARPLPETPYGGYDGDAGYTKPNAIPARHNSVSFGQSQFHGAVSDDAVAQDPLFSRTPQGNGATNAHLNDGAGYGGYAGYSSASDPEGTAGLEAMRLAEADQAAREAVSMPMPIDEEDDDSDDYHVDLDAYGGGFPGDTIGFYGASHSRTNSYADDPQSLNRQASTSTYDSLGRTTSVMTTSTMATTITQDSTLDRKQRQGGQTWDIPPEADLHPFAAFQSAGQGDASLDASGTGGLRRLSFDEGAEVVAVPSAQSASKPGSDDDDYNYLELFYHPEPSAAPRALPSLPQQQVINIQMPTPASYRENQTSLRPVNQTYATTPVMSRGGNVITPAPQFPRSTSLSSHGSAPVAVAPARSKTDAALIKNQIHRLSIKPVPESDPSTPRDSLISQLPSIPLTKKKFEPAKLSSRDFKKCASPWALSNIASWVRELAEGEIYLKEKTVEDGLVALFTHYVPTMNVADAETLAARVVKNMLQEGALIKDEEWIKFGDGEVCGVIYQICGSGCYAPRLHEGECPGRCYSHHCSRTLKKISLLPHPDEPQKKAEDWFTYWKVKKEDLVDVNKKEIERQNNLHEVVQTETEYMDHLWVLVTVYRDQMLQSNPPIIQPNKLPGFVREVFGKADAVRKVSEEHLLPQLKFRQQEQGPWVVGFSDIFREWIRKARPAYIEYAANFPRADMLVRSEAARNLVLKAFLDQCRQDPRAKRLDWVTFLKAPITRLRRYSLLLSTIMKHTLVDSEEKQNLAAAIEEIKAVTHECDARVDEQTKAVTLLELGTKLIMRPGMEVDLRLKEKGREIVHRGDLQRHTSRFNFIETHAILFDHYLVLAKTVQQKEIAGGAKHERYDVSRMVSIASQILPTCS